MLLSVSRRVREWVGIQRLMHQTERTNARCRVCWQHNPSSSQSARQLSGLPICCHSFTIQTSSVSWQHHVIFSRWRWTLRITIYSCSIEQRLFLSIDTSFKNGCRQAQNTPVGLQRQVVESFYTSSDVAVSRSRMSASMSFGWYISL